MKNDKPQEAKAILNKISKFNGNEYRIGEETNIAHSLSGCKMNQYELLKEIFKKFKMTLFNLTVNYTLFNCQWFLALYIVNGIKGNIFVNGIVYSFTDGMSMIFGGFIVNKFGTA